MAEYPCIARVRTLVSEIAQESAKMQEVAAGAADALRLPRPDTFLGRSKSPSHKKDTQ